MVHWDFKIAEVGVCACVGWKIKTSCYNTPQWLKPNPLSCRGGTSWPSIKFCLNFDICLSHFINRYKNKQFSVLWIHVFTCNVWHDFLLVHGRMDKGHAWDTVRERGSLNITITTYGDLWKMCTLDRVHWHLFLWHKSLSI